MTMGGRGLIDQDQLWLPTIWGFVGFGARLRQGLWDRGHAPETGPMSWFQGQDHTRMKEMSAAPRRRRLCGTLSRKLRGPRPGWIWTPGWRGSRGGKCEVNSRQEEQPEAAASPASPLLAPDLFILPTCRWMQHLQLLGRLSLKIIFKNYMSSHILLS